MILLIDNYDSFVHNLARYFRQLGQETIVVRNDAITVEKIRLMHPQAVVLSPGPCDPNQAGVSLAVVEQFVGCIPLLGVCLGHQAIVQASGGTLVKSGSPVHGRQSQIEHDRTGLFVDVPSPVTVGRYHSLIAEHHRLPDCLQVTARSEDGTIMAVSHRDHPVVGLQFHPESVLTGFGYRMLANFCGMAGLTVSANVAKLDEAVREPVSRGAKCDSNHGGDSCVATSAGKGDSSHEP